MQIHVFNASLFVISITAYKMLHEAGNAYNTVRRCGAKVHRSLKLRKKTTNVGSRSLKVMEFGNNRNGIYHFLVANSLLTSTASCTVSEPRRLIGQEVACGRYPLLNALAKGDSWICRWALYHRQSLDTLCYRLVKTSYVRSFWHNTGVRRMDIQTDRQTEML